MTTPPKKAAKPKKATTPVAVLPAALDTAPVAERPPTEPKAELLPDGSCRVPLGDGFVTVPRRGLWRSSANEDVLTGMYRTWASKVLAPDDWAFWLALDPTNDEVNEFFRLLNDAGFNRIDPGDAATRVGIG